MNTVALGLKAIDRDGVLAIQAHCPQVSRAIVARGGLIATVTAFQTRTGTVELWRTNAIDSYLFRVTPEQ